MKKIYGIEICLPKLLFHMKKEADRTVPENDVFPCQPGTKWDQVEMALLPSGEKFMVKTPMGNGYYDHIDLGLYDDRTTSKGPSKLWGFLKILAGMNGFFPLNGVVGKGFEVLSSKAKRLDNRLREVFGIKESIYKDRCNRVGGYKTKFRIYRISDDKFIAEKRSQHDMEIDDIEEHLNLKESDYYPENSSWSKKE